jgi:hypothetical protein
MADAIAHGDGEDSDIADKIDAVQITIVGGAKAYSAQEGWISVGVANCNKKRYTEQDLFCLVAHEIAHAVATFSREGYIIDRFIKVGSRRWLVTELEANEFMRSLDSTCFNGYDLFPPPPANTPPIGDWDDYPRFGRTRRPGG